jgi:hypothetical protein
MKRETITTLVSVLLLLAVSIVPTPAAGQSCRQAHPLSELVHTSDAIVVVQKKGFIARPAIDRGRLASTFPFTLLQTLKNPVRARLDSSTEQVLYPYGADHRRLRGERRYLVFMDYLRPGVWKTGDCRYFDITNGDLVRGICSAVSDLYGENPYVRERKCLLNLADAAPLAEVLAEITKSVPKDRSFAGDARIMRDLKWDEDTDFQEVVFEVVPRQRRAFFENDSLKTAITVQGYIRTATYTERELRQLVRTGKRVHLEGFWEKGNFMIARLR